MRGERNKDLRPRLNLPKELPHIPRHTDDFAPSVLVPVSKIQSDVASNWVFPAKEAPGECLVDDHHGRRISCIRRCKLAPSQQRDLQRCKMTGADGEPATFWLVVGLRHRMPFDSEGHIAREIVGKISGSGRRLHSGEICETLQNIFKELPLALRLEVLEVAEPDGSCEQVMRIKTHARLDLFEETIDKQPRAN